MTIRSIGNPVETICPRCHRPAQATHRTGDIDDWIVGVHFYSRGDWRIECGGAYLSGEPKPATWFDRACAWLYRQF